MQLLIHCFVIGFNFGVRFRPAAAHANQSGSEYHAPRRRLVLPDSGLVCILDVPPAAETGDRVSSHVHEPV